MALIRDEDRAYLQKLFSDEFQEEVRMILFTRLAGSGADGTQASEGWESEGQGAGGGPGDECPYCQAAYDLTKELDDLSPKLKVEIHDLNRDGTRATEFGIDKVPAIVLLDHEDKDFGVRFFGLPSGMEFSVLVADLLDFSKGQTRLAEPTKTALKGLAKDVQIDVFVTPT